MNRIKIDSLTENQLLNTNKQRYVPETGSRRYSIALKNLIPIRREKRDAGTNAIDSAGLFSSIGLSWMSKIMYKAHKEGLKMEKLPGVSPYDTCDYNADRLELICRKELAKKGRSKASLSMAAWKFCQTRIIISLIIYAGGISCGILSFSVFMRKLLDYVQSDDVEYEEGVKWAILITASKLLRIMLLRWSTVMNHRTGIRMKSACLTLLYRKIIRANNLQQNSIGEVINMFSNDAQRMYDLLSIGPQIIEAPIITVFLIVYISSVLSPIALVGIAVLLLYYPIEYVMSKFIGHFRNKAIKISDKRISLMNEILDSVKLIKMYAWENRFSQDLLGLRKKELKLILNTSCSQHLSIAATQTMSVISAIIAFLLHAKTGNILTAAQLFPCSTMIDSQLRVALFTFRDASQSIVLAGISFKRIQVCRRLMGLNVLFLEDDECTILKAIHQSHSIAISHGTFAYNVLGSDIRVDTVRNTVIEEKNETTSEADEGETKKLKKLEINTDHVDVLFNISFEAARGKLVGICGPVGSGKSSLLLAVLGQLRASEGQVTRHGDCAYVSQKAWITNATLRGNILFGAEFDEIRYNKVIQACSLIQDIAMMPGGDQTEIGERGINLSGGQKQRVALARALYSDRDIFLLDDPLSAVDSQVGSSIFDSLILGALKEKTVVFVTHQTQYLSHCDDVYVMRDGRIVEHGTHDELIKLNNEYASLIASVSGDGETENNTPGDLNMITIPKSVDDVPLETRNQRHTDASTEMNNTNVDTESELTANLTAVPGTSLTVTEELRQGTVNARTYHSYIVAAGGYGVAFMAIFMYCTAVLSNAFSFWWLALWIEAGGSSTTTVGNIATEPSDMKNMTIVSQNVNENSDQWYYYTIYAWMIAIIALTNTLRGLVFSRATVAASTRIHKNLFKKILDCPMRFFDTTPTGRIQHLFSRDMDEVDVTLPTTLANCTVLTLRVITSVLITCLVFPWYILPVCLTAILYYYVSRILRVAVGDLKNMENKSRGPVISHVTETVQGLNTIHAFGKEKNFSAKFAHLFDENSKHLFMFNLSIIWFEIRIEVLALAAISFTAFLVIIFKGQVSPSLAGLAIAYSVQIAGILPYLWTLLSQTDARMSSVERLNYYIRTVEKEGCTIKSVITPLSTWPAVPGIKFTNVSMAYGDRAPLILKNVSFYVHAGEKIGIVGRTGAGKSSLTIALFRLVELVEGKIEIDDVDISQISLRQLRTKLSIIPQDPVLFSGTVRSNLDPFKLYSDAEIWDALEKTELKSRVQSISGQLDATVGFGGDNMSVGERQLLCLSRALLRNSKILVLDEATASVDPGTEKAVQDTIQREFSQCTILTIAHRLQTVNSLNRVLVMDDGQVLEFDTPANLLANPCSQFSKMTEAAERAGSQ